MGVPTSEVGYTSVTTGRGDHEVHKGHVVVLGGKKHLTDPIININIQGTPLHSGSGLPVCWNKEGLSNYSPNDIVVTLERVSAALDR
jgi:hypothetical protein